MIFLFCYLVIVSYPLSHLFLKKGMELDFTMPLNKKKYNILKFLFFFPIINIILCFSYLIITIITYNRKNFNQ